MKSQDIDQEENTQDTTENTLDDCFVAASYDATLACYQ